MACFAPLYGWQRAAGQPLFFGAEPPDSRRVDISCGYCLGCRLARARAWSIRCMHESQLHRVSSFVTLTYDDQHVRLSLDYRDFRLFVRKLRRAFQSVRFYMCGEYGEQTLRPHFHALLFGVGFRDLRPCGRDLYRSPSLEKLWPHGFSSVGEVNARSAGYVARYAVKKVYGPRADSHYRRLDLGTGQLVPVSPEFSRMSLKPGIGYGFFRKYWREIYSVRDGVVFPGGFTCPPPRYYDKLLLDLDPDLREWRDYTRYVGSASFVSDCSPQRLMDRELVARARLSQARRFL